jgi:hypothetical protein
VWTRATPEATLAARAAGATAALARLLSDSAAEEIAEAAELADAAVRLLDPAGHPLGAANMALDPGTDPLTRLWQAATTLREHRGDGHVAALVAYGFSGVESAVWRTEPWLRAELQPSRGWPDPDWDGAIAALTERGWLDGSGAATDAGAARYQQVEDATDQAAVRVWERFGAQRAERLLELLTPMAVVTFAEIPRVNPIHLPEPNLD